jgi:hypothetical protein
VLLLVALALMPFLTMVRAGISVAREPGMDEAGPFQIRAIEKRAWVSGRDVSLSKLVAEGNMAAVIKSAKLRELAAMKVAQAGAKLRNELHLMNLESEEEMASRHLAQDRKLRDFERAICLIGFLVLRMIPK